MNKKMTVSMGMLLALGVAAAVFIGMNKPVAVQEVKTEVATTTEAVTPSVTEVKAPVSSQKDVLWGQQMGTAEEDLTTAIAVDANGYHCIAGYTAGDLIEKNKGGKDIIVMSYSADGKRQWAVQTGTESTDQANSVVFDSAGNLYVTGLTVGSFGKDSGIGQIFVQKINREGKILWTKQYGGTDRAMSNAIAIDSKGNLFIGGSMNGQMGKKAFGGSDAFISKMDKDGRVIWTSQWGADSSEEVTGLDFDPEGNIYVIGQTDGKLGEEQIGQMDIFLSKLSPDGKVLYSQQYGSTVADRATKILVDGDRNVYLTGWTNGDFVGTQVGNGDSIFLKVSNDGKILWKKQFGTDLWDGIHSIVQSKNDPDSVIVGGCQNYSDCQAFLRKYDTNGNEIWIQDLIPEFSTCGREIGIDDKGFIYQTGGTHGQLYGEKAFEGVESDVFVYKISEKVK